MQNSSPCSFSVSVAVVNNLFFFVLHKIRRPELLKAVYDKGFNKPSKIQENALPLILGTYGRYLCKK